jgi:hypothetical protein
MAVDEQYPNESADDGRDDSRGEDGAQVRVKSTPYGGPSEI